MRKPKDLYLENGQKAFINMNEILLVIDYRKISPRNCIRLARWLVKASNYIKSRKEQVKHKPEPVAIII